jgi:hypothetical protein
MRGMKRGEEPTVERRNDGMEGNELTGSSSRSRWMGNDDDETNGYLMLMQTG